MATSDKICLALAICLNMYLVSYIGGKTGNNICQSCGQVNFTRKQQQRRERERATRERERERWREGENSVYANGNGV